MEEKLTLGCDPELFLWRDGRLLPAWEVLPHKNERRGFFWDGFQAEFLVSPASSPGGLVSGIRDGLATLRSAAGGASLKVLDCLEVEPSMLEGLAEEYVALGCDPSINVYGDRGQLPANPRDLPLRFAGGHIHFGSGKLRTSINQKRAAAMLVMDLDKVLGVWSVGAAAAAEPLKARRLFYGLAGEMRVPEWGAEYRVLGNFWLGHPRVARLVLEMAGAVYEAHLSGWMKSWLGDSDVVKYVINEYDVEKAREMLLLNEKLFVFLLNKVITPEAAQAALQAGLVGLENVVPEPFAVERNWLLDNLEVPCQSVWGG